MPTIPTESTTKYYHAALQLLRYMENRKPTNRRFGREADALWSNFRGDLTPSDRIDLLIRDADAEWPGAFGGRSVFGLDAVSEDDPFGADWQSLDPIEAGELWHDAQNLPLPADAIGVLESIAKIWDVSLSPMDLPPVGPAEQLVIAGPGAIASAVRAFEQGADLDWSAQVICVASSPGHRQIAGAATALLGSARPTPLVSDAAAIVQGTSGRRLLVSDDALPEDRELAERIARGE